MKKEWDEGRLFLNLGLVPPGPAFVYEEKDKTISKVEVNGYFAENIWLEDRGAFIQRLLAYRCNLISFSNLRLMGGWSPETVFATREEAERKTKFTVVELPNEAYIEALGVDENARRVDSEASAVLESEGIEPKDKFDIYNCELEACCSNVSEIRDLLSKCMERHGLEQWRIDRVSFLLDEEGLAPSPDCPNLSRILEVLGIPNQMTPDKPEEKEEQDHG